MSEDVLQKLNKQKEEREKTHATIKGMFEGIRLTRQSETDKGILKVLEFVMDGFKNTSDSFGLIMEGFYYVTQRVEKLEKEVKQLQRTVDTFQESK
jgi:polyhydroxyalkanoate synthesis regulator phasin